MKAPVKPTATSPPVHDVQTAIATAVHLARAYRPTDRAAATTWRRLARALEDAALPAVGALAMDGAGTVGT